MHEAMRFCEHFNGSSIALLRLCLSINVYVAPFLKQDMLAAALSCLQHWLTSGLFQGRGVAFQLLLFPWKPNALAALVAASIVPSDRAAI